MSTLLPSVRALRGSLVLALVVACGAYTRAACQADYDPVDTPLSWTATGGLVISHLEQYSSGDVYTANCRGSGLFAVADSASPARTLAEGAPICHALMGRQGVAVAPDEAWAAFLERTEPNNYRLARLHLATNRADPLDTGCAYLQNPVISPDGARIGAPGLCRDGQADWALYVMNRDGSGLRRVAGDVNGEAPSWSPDGNWLAASHEGRVVVIPAAGGRPREVTTGLSPAWSPDGAWIAFMDTVPGVRPYAPKIFVVRVDGSGRREVFRNQERGTFHRGFGERLEGEPSQGLVWAPDSRWIAFPRRFGAGVSVWRVR